MLIDVRCPKCKEVFQFDDTQSTMFCPFCGCKTTKAAPPVQPASKPAPVQAQNPNAAYVPQPQGTATPVNVPQATKKAKSPLSIIAFVLSFTIYFSWAGAALGIVDFAVDKKKEKTHTFSYWAIAIGAFFTFYIVYTFVSGGDLSYLKPNSNGSNSYVTAEADSTSPTYKDGSVNLSAIESMDVVQTGKKYTIYNEDFCDCIIEARWWDYDGSMDKPGIYGKDADTLGFSIEVKKDTDYEIYYAYYYSSDKDFDKSDLKKPIFYEEIEPETYGDGAVYYNVDYSKRIKKGYYLVIVASDSSLKEPYIVAYAEVK